MELNYSLLNTTTILNPFVASEYVTIESCKTYVAQTNFWMFFYGIAFVLTIIILGGVIVHYRKKLGKL